MRKVFFVTGTLILALSFLLLSCGSIGDPMIKALAQTGAYAIFFPENDTTEEASPDNPQNKYLSAGSGTDMSDHNVTVEAWVKSTVDEETGEQTISGTVLARGIVGAGFILFIEDNVAKFGVSSGDVSSTTTLNDGIWHHVAGVLVGSLPPEQTHNHTVTATCDANAMTGDHVDIYVDGVYEDCAEVTMPDDMEDCGCQVVITYNEDGTVACETPNPGDEKCVTLACSNFIGRDLAASRSGLFRGTLDEVRLWREERTAEQIATWRATEITAENWSQANPNNALVGYWKFNEGSGHTAMDSSGYGNNATKLLYLGQDDDCGNAIDVPEWDDGWVEGYPF